MSAALFAQSAVMTGRVRHRRYLPKTHSFGYRQWMIWQDLDDIPTELEQPGIATRIRRAGLCLRRQDYLQPHQAPMSTAIRDYVEAQTGERPAGKVFFLGHPRQWGYCFNPVVFYFCCGADDRPRAIVAEINNTPWDERHRYLMPVTGLDEGGRTHKFLFPKAFHVSPFMPMDLNYEWSFTFYRSGIGIFMALHRAGKRVFDASLGLRTQPVRTLGQMPWRHPLQCQRVSFGIYWQALLLRLKRLRVFDHPERSEQA